MTNQDSPPLRFPGAALKNDALFLYGATQPLPYVHCYQQHTIEVVHGPACKPQLEVQLERCAQEGVAVVKRRGGGGTVVLSPGMVVVVVVGARETSDAIPDIFGRIHRAMGALIQPLWDKPLLERGLSDLAIGDRKVCGSSLYLGKHPLRYYYQSSLMVESDRALISRYLSHPPREPDYRQSRSHDAFCTTLAEEGFALDSSGVVELFNRSLAHHIILQSPTSA
jgi:lipoate-protein ligase A